MATYKSDKIEYELIDKIYIKNNTLIIELNEYPEISDKLLDITIFSYFDVNDINIPMQYYLYASLERVNEDKISKIFSIYNKIPKEYCYYIEKDNFNIFLIYKNHDYGTLLGEKIMLDMGDERGRAPTFFSSDIHNVNDFLAFLDNQEAKRKII
jgi:hypothetical protein